MNNEYKLSGKSGNIFIIGILIGPILVTLLSIIYAYIDVYNPIVYFTFLVYIGLLFGIIAIQKIVIKLSKCRSRTSSIIYGLIVGLFGFYTSWCTFIYVMYQRDNIPVELLDLMQNPALNYEHAKTLSIEGYYTLFGISIKGGLLWLIWIIEALGIIGAGTLGGLAVMHEEIFCENCKRWAENTNFDLRLSIEDKDTTKRYIETDITKILVYPNYNGVNSEHIRVNLHQCSKCQNTSTIDIDRIWYETNNKGEIVEMNEDYSKVYILDNKQLNLFMDKKLSPKIT